MALRTPISRVRSVTLTSMMFITPMPPTSSATEPTANISAKIPSEICFQRSMKESVVKTAKSSGLFGGKAAHAAQVVANFVDDFGHVLGVVHFDEKRVILVFGMDPQKSRERKNSDIVVGIFSVAEGLALMSEHADDGEALPFDENFLTEGVFVRGKKRVGGVPAENDDRRAVLLVGIVEKAAVLDDSDY